MEGRKERRKEEPEWFEGGERKTGVQGFLRAE